MVSHRDDGSTELLEEAADHLADEQPHLDPDDDDYADALAEAVAFLAEEVRR